MKTTALFDKKLNNFLYPEQAQRERYFCDTFINSGFQYMNGFHLSDISSYCTKVESFGGQIIGFETNIDVHNLHIVTFEEFNENYIDGWWTEAIQYFRKNGIDNYIYVYTNFTKEIMDQYLD